MCMFLSPQFAHRLMAEVALYWFLGHDIEISVLQWLFQSPNIKMQLPMIMEGNGG